MSLNRHGLGMGRGLSVALLASLLVIAGSVLLTADHHLDSSRASSTNLPVVDAQATAQRLNLLGKAPLFFEPNQGQTDSRVKFLARGAGYGLFLTANQAVLKLQGPKTSDGSALAMKLIGANAEPHVEGTVPLPGKSNYLIGNDPAKWHVGIPQFARVEYSQIYPGIDLVYYGRQGQLEYDFRLAPGADPRRIAMSFDGAPSVNLSEHTLEIETGTGRVLFDIPKVYQKVGGEERAVEGRFVRLAANTFGFELSEYDRSRELVIDPVLSYSTYLGGTGDEASPKIAVDSGLNFYVAGMTTSADFPGTTATGRPDGPSDTFIAKFNPSGSALVFATYLGGNGTETAAGIGVDGAFNVYVGGTTTSTDFPHTATAFQSAPLAPGTHVYVTQLNPTGSTNLYSTYLSGSETDIATGFTIDNRANAYVTGTTTSDLDFPTTSGTQEWPPANPNIQFFVSKINTAGAGPSSLPFSTYFGGGRPVGGTAVGGGVAVDSSGNVYITGATNFLHLGTGTGIDLDDFPILNATQSCLDIPTPVPAPDPAPACDPGRTALDAFVAKFNPSAATGAQLLYSTYLGGGAEDIGTAISVDTANNAYITGSTASADFITSKPSTSKPYQPTIGGGLDAFIAKVSGTQNTTTSIFPLTYFSYLGGNATDVGQAIVADTVQGVRVTGVTSSANFPTASSPPPSPAPVPLQPAIGGGEDAFIARIDTTTTSSSSGAGQFSSWLGGSGNDQGTGVAIDSNNAIYVTGQTASGNFPTAAPFQATLKAPTDAFVSKISAASTLTIEASSTPTVIGVGNQVTFKYAVKNTGPDPAFNVVLSDVLPSTGATFVSATASPGSCTGATGSPATVTCSIGALAVNATSTVSIVVTPSTVAPLGNSATVTYNNGSTVSASISTTVTDFNVSVAPTSVTVPAGQTATYTVTVDPDPTYSGSIALSCSSGLPTGAACTFTSSPVTIPNTTAVTAQLAISTTARPTPTSSLWTSGWIYALCLPIGGIALLGSGVRRKRWIAALFVVLLFSFIGLQMGCGSDTVTPPATSGTPAGTYIVTVSGTSGTASRTNTLTLEVQ